MKYLCNLLIIILLSSCNFEKIVQLPQISDAPITEITDHSSIYIFYDDKTQSADLQRNSLITSTHWIFHIDRRNSIKETIDIIHQMQVKKANPMNPHNNPDSRNYFSVADMKNKQLGFLDFSSVSFSAYNLKNENTEIKIKNNSLFVENQEVLFDEINLEKEYILLFEPEISFQQCIDFYWNFTQKGMKITSIQYIKNE